MASQNQKLLDIMNGRIQDTNEIAKVLAKVSDAEFVDVLNYLDGSILVELMHKLPENRRNMVSDFGKVRYMAKDIHAQNEFFDVDAEEYVKNSENLEKWKINLQDKDFANAREVVSWMNVSDEAKQLLMDTAVMKVKEESRNVKNLTEKQYKDAINFEIQLAVFQAVVATSAVKQEKNPKVATQEAVNQFVEATRKQIERHKQENKPTTNFLDVSVDSILAYSASTSEWIDNRLGQAKRYFSDTKLGAKIVEITDTANKKLAVWDKKLCEHKTWGKTYKYMKKYAPVVGAVTRSMAVNVGMLTLAGMTGPAGMALYAAYAVKTSCKPLIDEYKKEKKNNQNLHFAAFVGNNKMLTLKGVVGTGTMIVGGLMGYDALGIGALKARIAVTATSGVINSAVIYQQDKKAANAALAAGQTPAKEASMWSAARKGLGNAAIGFGLGWLLGGHSSTEDATGKNGLMMPEDYKAQLEAAQNDSIAQDTMTNNSISKVLVGTDVEKVELDANMKDILALVDNSCCEENSASQVVAANDCEAKIAAQENAPETDADKQFWGDRANKFVKPCDQNAITALFKLGVFKLNEMPGIGSEIEFIYKFGLMKEMNLPHQRGIVEMIEEKIDAIQEIGCDEKLTEQQKAEAFCKITSYGKDGGETIADEMNSYSNRGHYLCEEPKSVVKSSNPPVKEQEVPVSKTPEEPVVTPTEPESKNISFSDGERYTEEKLVHKDYRNLQLVEVHGNEIANNIVADNGEYINYSFKDGILTVSEANLHVTEHVKSLAEQLKGFPDVQNSETAALEIVAKASVCSSLENSNLDGVVGYEQWVNNFSNDLEKHGIVFNVDEGSIGVNEDFNKEQAIVSMNEQLRLETEEQDKHPFSNLVKRIRGKDY